MEKKAKIIGLIMGCLLLLFCSCKKEDRTCWKGHGDDTSIEIPLDSVYWWNLGKGIKYRIFQDTMRKLVVKGGENMVNHISADMDGYDINIANNNKCNFLRNSKQLVEVEIHYPHLGRFYIEPSDSVVFEETITSDTIRIEIAHGGGSLIIDVDTDFINIVVAVGTGDFTLSGNAFHSEVKVQDRGFADATNFTANSLFAYQNSTADLYINMEGAGTLVVIDGIGDVYAKGTPVALATSIKGSGELLEY